MITPSFGLTATERVLPRMALDFTTAVLDPRVTFTRTGNTATVTNSSGFVVPINADLPRFDFNPITLFCRGLLIEEARTNLYTYSEDFTNAAWTKVRSSISANATTSPSNVLDADKLIEDTSASNNHFFRVASFTPTSGTTYTWSIFAKAGERSQIALGFNTENSAFTDNTALFTLTGSGSSSIVAGSPSPTITAFGNGWYKCTVTATATATAVAFLRTSLAVNGNLFYTGDGTSGLFVWGAQLEAGAFATSYIPTVASQVTRTADVATMTGTNFSDWFNASEGAFAYWTNVFSDNSSVFLQCSKTGSGYAELLSIQRDAALDRWQLLGYEGGVLRSNLLTITNTFTINSNNKCVYSYKNASYAASANATTIQTSTGNIPSGLNRLAIGHDLVGSGSFMSGYVQKILYYPQRLINAEVLAFSK